MSIFNDKALKGVSEAVAKIMDEELKGNQHKIDANHNGKIDGQDFKILKGKKTVKESAEKAKMDYDKDGKVESPKAEVLGSRIRAAKAAGKLKEETELDEAFPTVADGEKSLKAKEGKTSSGTITKTKTGLVHKRDFEHNAEDDDHPEKRSRPSSYGARQNYKRSTRVNEQKLSFTEMLHLYNESGIEVIAKIMPEKVKFGETEVEVIDANIVNGAVAVTVAEEVDNETFTKEVEAQKEKNAGKGKKAEVAKASVQAVKQEEVEHLDEISADLAGKYLTAPQGKGANKYKTGEGTSRYPNADTMIKHGKSLKRALQRADISSLNKKPSYYKEEEQLDELSKSTLASYTKRAVGRMDAISSAKRSHLTPAGNIKKGSEEKVKDINQQLYKRYKGISTAVDKLAKEEVEQLDEKLPASATAGDYIHDFVHSDNPKFAGKSTKERQKMALGAFYAKNKGK